MKYNVLVGLISKHLADEIVSQSEMLSYMDRVIDDINARLNTVFPTFTEYKEDNPEIDDTVLDYTAIPDKYLRTVVVPGAAFKYYTTDEEGGYSSPKYEEDYNNGLFYMIRDYSFSVPAEYRAENQGYVDMPLMDAGLEAPLHRGGIF
jgi:hypothetical protein